MDLGSLQGTPLQDLHPRKVPGIPDLDLDLDQEVLEGIIQGHDLSLALIDDPVAGLLVKIIEDVVATVILPCLLTGVMWGIRQILILTVVLEYLSWACMLRKSSKTSIL